MIRKATKLISDELNKERERVRIEEFDDGTSAVVANLAIKNGSIARVYFISTDEDMDTRIRIYGLMNDVDPSKCDAVLKVLNKLNCEISYLKFALDSDNDIGVAYDLPYFTSPETIGVVCRELMCRIVNDFDDAFQQIARVIYTD